MDITEDNKINVKHKDVTIIVNTIEKPWEKEKISYEEVIVLAFDSYNPNVVYTVDYLNGPQSNVEGSLVAGGKDVKVKEGMIFNVTQSNKS